MGIDLLTENHVIRHADAEMNGVPIESVSKMLGHTNIRTTQLYAKILDEKVGNDMAPIRKMFVAV